MILISLLFPSPSPVPVPPISISQTQTQTRPPLHLPTPNFHDSKPKQSAILSHLLSLSLALTLNSPLSCSAIPSLNSPSLPTTPFSQSKNLLLGLENGKIRACPSINPGCVSTNANSSSFSFPWRIPSNSAENAIQKLQQAILKTQKNPIIQLVQDTSDGTYLQAEVDGGFGRDVLEFLVKGDIVAYRCMATKVTYVYPFTTAFGDSKGQEERTRKIVDELGWDAPRFDSMD